MNFKTVYKQGQLGKNFGYTTGIKKLDMAINGIQKKTTIGLAAAPKCGKTTLCDFAFVISPYLQAIRLNRLDKIRWIYLSGEIDRISKEFKFAAYFMYYDHGVFQHEYKGKTYFMNQDYLMGKQLHFNEDDTSEIIPVTPEHDAYLKQVYVDRILPLFGVWDDNGKCIEKGKIDFIEDIENPTGINKYLMNYAKENGKFIEQDYWTVNDEKQRVQKKRITGYIPNDLDLTTIIITDHIRKLKRERGFTMKENIDKYLEYSTFLRNICLFTFIHIVHSNRNLGNVERLKFAGEWIYPTADDVKDSGNVAEECTILMTLFNPNDEKYNIQKHMNVELKDHPNYRSIHITESRYTECPVHIQTNMFGGVNLFTSLNSEHA
jgi:hypothetical protein